MRKEVLDRINRIFQRTEISGQRPGNPGIGDLAFGTWRIME
jgi:hypothetical protein